MLTARDISSDEKRQKQLLRRSDCEASREPNCTSGSGEYRKNNARGRFAPPRAWCGCEFRYGRLTVVPSPDAEMLKVPPAVLAEYAYGVVQPVGGVGIVAMNGPAVWV